MPRISRRTLLSYGVAASAASLLHRPISAEQTAMSATGPREKLLFDFGWKFRFGHGLDPSKDLDFGFGESDFSKAGEFRVASVGYDDSSWRPLNLPHDWAVDLPFVHDDVGSGDAQLRSHGYKPLGRRYPETSIGWYRREFEIPSTDLGRRISIDFDGVFRDALVFLNGCFIGRNNNGYTPFHFDISDYLFYGGKNYLVLRVDASFGDGWFYEGAGIYRHVWLMKTDLVHLGKWESVIQSKHEGNRAKIELSTIVQNESRQPVRSKVKWKIIDQHGQTVINAESSEQLIAAVDSVSFIAYASILNPSLWTIEEPHLYSAILSVETNGKVNDLDTISFGIRTAVFDPDKGFFLNGKSLKIKGTCNHQDHAGVGSALPDGLQSFRLSILREMGCNAVRTTHNMPTPEWVDACDRMGVMMMCETRQLSSTPDGMNQLELMVKRYRNSPSIIIWSIENEERHMQKRGEMADQGARIAATMVDLCHRLDPTRVVSAAVDGDNLQGVSESLDIIGFNYNQNLIESFRSRYPHRPIFGSETSSAVSTRGVYVNDKLLNTASSTDGYWGIPEDWWKFYGSRTWATGGFAWTGFDYRGEPSPYGWPSISSQFGIVDTCGFPKDFYYYYRAWWRDEPLLHLFPHWNWHGREGDEIEVWAYSNLEEVELVVNGQTLGVKEVPHLGHVSWKVRYEPGNIEARGRIKGAIILTHTRQSTGLATSLRISADRSEIDADGEDVAILKVEALDSEGRVVPTADNKVKFNISGPGKLIGVGNGDPNCQESDKEPTRSLFNGLAQSIIQSSKTAGDIRIEASADGLGGKDHQPATLIIRTIRVPLRPAVDAVR